MKTFHVHGVEVGWSGTRTGQAASTCSHGVTAQVNGRSGDEFRRNALEFVAHIKKRG